MTPMDIIQKRIDELESAAAASELLSLLAIDPDVRLLNGRMAEEFRQQVAWFRTCFLPALGESSEFDVPARSANACRE